MPVGAYAGANVSNGNGVTTLFPYNFKILDQTHIEVKVGGVLKVLGADYTVTGVGLSNGGNVNFTVAPANGAVVQRARKVPYTRAQDYQNNGDFQENTVDSDFDLLEMQVQQLSADVTRAFKAPLSVTDDQVVTDANWAARAGRVLGFDALGNFLLLVGQAGSSLVDLASSLGASLIGFMQAGAAPTYGWATRTLQGRAGDEISVKDVLCADGQAVQGNGVHDDTTGIQAALDYAALNNLKLFFPKGVYIVTAGLVINGVSATSVGKLVHLEGVGGQVDGTPGATIIKWNGTDDAANTLFKANGLARLICKGIAFYGSAKVGKVFWATQNVGVSFSPFGWRFEDCTFEAAKAGNYGFYIDTAVGMARFNFLGCLFQAGAGAESFSCSNANSLNHQFVCCSFGPSSYGIHINGGSFVAIGCEFAQNSGADVYLQICSSCTMIDCWTEQSKQFIVSDFRTQNTPLTLIGCTSSSCPWTYWKLDEAGRAQPPNDLLQWIHILWDGDRGALNLIGCVFNDPFNGAAHGAVAPTVALAMLVSATNGTNNSSPRFNFVGSLAQAGAANTFTEQFFMDGNGQMAAPRIPSRKKIQNYGNLTGAFGVASRNDSTARWTMTGNCTATLVVTNCDAGDRFAVDVTQDGVGGRTQTFVNAKTAGVFTPTAAAGARSRIEFEFDGASWIEVSRALNLA